MPPLDERKVVHEAGAAAGFLSATAKTERKRNCTRRREMMLNTWAILCEELGQVGKQQQRRWVGIETLVQVDLKGREECMLRC